MRSVWFGLGVIIAACSGGGGEHAPAMPADVGGSTSGGTRAHISTGDTSSGGMPGAGENQGGAGLGQGGADDAGAGAGEIVFETAGAPATAPPGLCDPTMTLGQNMAQDVGTSGATLLSMTADELSVAFTTGSGDSLALHVSDRPSPSGEFVEAAFTLPDGYEGASGVALSGDGLALILVSKDHAGFAQVTRAARGAAFGTDVDTTPFAKINALKPMSGHSVGWPVVSNDGQSLYFLSYFGQALVVQSQRAQNGVFDFGTEIDPFTLGGEVGHYKLLSGLSSDERAIFFFDQATQHSMALFRSRAGAPFYDPLDLGARQGAAPNQDCSRVYSSLAGGLVVRQATQ